MIGVIAQANVVVVALCAGIFGGIAGTVWELLWNEFFG